MDRHASRPREPESKDEPPLLIGIAALAKRVFDRGDLTPLRVGLLDRIAASGRADAAALLDLSSIELLSGEREVARRLQAEALALARCFREPTAARPGAPRLLAFCAPGDFMANTPLEFLLAVTGIHLERLYLLPGEAFPTMVADHDVAIVAIGESLANRPILDALQPALACWPRPVLNRPDRIVGLARERLWRRLAGIPGLYLPMTRRVGRRLLGEVARGRQPLPTLLAGADFPIIARPVDSHAGQGLARIDGREALADWLGEREGSRFTIAPFVEYRGEGGLYRKARIALIAGEPYPCHFAISRHWMIHYLNAGMAEDAGKRAEEARFFTEFADGFARRHAPALAAIARRIGLDYVVFDCAELPDGRLILFEADVAMIVHAMDPPEVFPYKRAPMQRLFAAFAAMVEAAAR